MSIEKMVKDFIALTGLAKITEQDGQRGVRFQDKKGFIPFDDLGYNRELGFYSLSQFPEVANQAERLPEH